MFDDCIDPSILGDFIIESREHLDSVETGLLELEKDPSDLDTINSIFRGIHTIKGGASFLELKKITRLAHQMENLLDDLRKERIQFSSAIVDIVLAGSDVIIQLFDEVSSLLNSCEDGNIPDFDSESSIDIDGLISQIEEIKNSGSGSTESSTNLSEESGIDTCSPNSPVASTDNVSLEEKTETNNNNISNLSINNTTEETECKSKQDIESPQFDIRNADEAMQKAFTVFLSESVEMFEAISMDLVELEKNHDDMETINSLFRSVHNFKGNVRYLGFSQIEKLAHHMENVLDSLRNGTLKTSSAMIDCLLNSLDKLQELLTVISNNESDTSIDIDHLTEELSKFTPEQPKQKQADKTESISPATSQSDDARDIFIAAADIHLSNINNTILKIEQKSADEQDYDIVLRAFSGLKSSANYMKYDVLKDFALQFENYIRKTIENRDFLSPQAYDLLKRTGEYLATYFTSLKKSGIEEEPDGYLVADILIAMQAQGQKSEKLPGVDKKDNPVATEHTDISPTGEKSTGDSSDKLNQKNSQDKTQTTQEVSNISGSKKKSSAPVQESKVSSVPKSAKSDQAQKTPKTDHKKAIALENTIRVDQVKLDTLMNLIGELIIVRNTFSTISKRLENDSHETAKDFKEATTAMERISDDLQSTIMSARMVPVSIVFNKYTRMVRDLAKSNNKNIRLVISGEETEMDKTVIEQIGDPLVHLIRNSADHGVESPEERIKAGKSPEGTIYLRAYYEGNSVIIEIEDDGNGIDPNKLKKKALEKGIITQKEYETMDDDTAVNLIFAPGFSTADTISNISGRGVGMDVVRTNIQKLKGSITIKTELHKGTKILLVLPLTLAIVDTVMVRVEDNVFAIPLQSIAETVLIHQKDIKYLKKHKSINLRNMVIGIEDLAGIIGIQRSKDIFEQVSDNDEGQFHIIIIQDGAKKIGFIVDELLDKQEILIKPLIDFLSSLKGISGSTILGDGSIVLILEPVDLIDIATGNAIKTTA